MSEALKPWIYKYFYSYVSKHGDVGKIHTQRGKVQILQFLSVPKTDEEYLWANVSDKDCVIPARFTLPAVKSFNDKALNAGRPLLTRLSAVAVITCKQLLRCRPPLGVQKGLSPAWQIALEIDEVDVIACEGEPQFGEPREFNRLPLVQKWLEGLAKGQGSSIKEHINETMAGEGLSCEVMTRRNESVNLNTSENSKSSKQLQPDASFEKRYRHWMQNGLLACYEHSEVDYEELRSKNASEGRKALDLTSSNLNQPTTPSHWSHSEMAFSDLANCLSDNESNSADPLPKSTSGFIADFANNTNEIQLDISIEAHSDNPAPTDDTLPSTQHIREAKVLVPDSDPSHSQLPLPTQPGEDHLTTFSIPETSPGLYQLSSQLKGKENVIVPQSVPYETDEALPNDSFRGSAEKIAESIHPSPVLCSQRREQKRRFSKTDMNENSQDLTKRTKTSSGLTHSNALHDPFIWKQPSFMASSNQRNVGCFPRDSDKRDITTRCDQAPDTNNMNGAARLKLGGWRPDWALEKIPGIMNHEMFKALLTRIAVARKGPAHKLRDE